MEVEIVNESESRIVVKDEEGRVIECEKLFTFDSDETGLSYICYTDNQKDNENNVIVHAGTYDKSGEDNRIIPIKTDREWKIIQETLEEIIKNVKEVKDE